MYVAPFSVSFEVYSQKNNTKYIYASSFWGIYHLHHHLFDPEPHKGHKLA